MSLKIDTLKKNIKTESNTIITPRSNQSNNEKSTENEKNKENNDIKYIKDNSYSSFIISLIEQPVNYKKHPRSKLFPKIINNNLSKSKLNQENTESNITPRLTNNVISRNVKFENMKFPTEKSLSINNKKHITLNNVIYKEKRKRLSPIKFNENRSIKTIDINDNNSNSINNYNYKNNYYSQKSLSNNKKNITNINSKSIKDKNLNLLSKLYGYNKKYLFSKNKILEKKNIDIENYQNNIIKISQQKLSKDNLIKLYTNLQTIKTDAEMIKPLPPINYPALILHSFKEVDDKEKHLGSLYRSKKVKDMDEYEKELYEIKKNSTKKKTRLTRNKRINKIYEILPEYVVDAVFKNKNKI